MEEVHPCISHTTEIMIFIQTKAQLLFLKALTNKYLEDENNGKQDV
jgi:hypothetical protein